MTVARLNYTGRQRIVRDDVMIQLTARDGTIPSFKVMLDFGNLDLPDEAHVTVEAFRRTWVQREWLGAVSDVADREHGPFQLDGIHDAAGVKFRVKVISASQSPQRGLLLAVGDRLTPTASADTPREVVSLLPVGVDDLGDLTWRIDCDVDEGPVLWVHKDLGRDMARKPYFRALVFPSALQQILDTVRLSADTPTEFDEDNWQLEWLRFGQGLAGPYPEDPMSDDSWGGWCGNVVSHFASKHALRRQFAHWQEGTEQ